MEDSRREFIKKIMESMVIATPDHGHAPATILACKAGRHVYIEKPCSHNPLRLIRKTDIS